ncbi:Cro/CI family transcriptional regulator [Pseudomonas orientalis]|uniref:Cro/CI family transcriptional regulator n=1 Tax=Pseudomonas orientalis TaxID=76758 RepID=UPI002FE10FA7
MTPILLTDFVADRGQDEAARILGSSQTTISKALKSGRLILVTEREPGVFSALEFKGFPSGGAREKARLDLADIVGQVGAVGQTAISAVNPSSSARAAQ